MSGSTINRTSAAIVHVTVWKTRTNAGAPGTTAGTGQGHGTWAPAELADDRLLPPPESQIFVPPEEEAAAEEAVEVFAAQFNFPDTLPDPDFFIWDHSQDQSEYLADPIAADEAHASQPVFPDPLDPADFFQWNQPQDQLEAFLAPPPFEEAIEALIAADPIPSTQFPLPDPDFFIWEHRPEQNEWALGRIHLENNAEGGSDDLEMEEGPLGNTGGASGNYFDEIIGGTAFFPTFARFDTDRTIDNFSYRLSKNFAISPSVSWVAPPYVSLGGTRSLVTGRKTLFARFYVWIGAYAPGDLTLFLFFDDSFAVKVRAGITGVDSGFGPGMIFFGDSGGTAVGGGPVPLERWVRVEMWVNLEGVSRKEFRVWWTDPNSAGAPDATLGPDFVGTPTGNIIQVEMGNTQNYTGGGDLFIDNIGVDTLDWLGPLGTAPAELAVSPNTITAAQRSPMDVVHPWPAHPYELWDHRQEQDEWLFEVVPSVAVEELVAADMFSSGAYPSRPMEAADVFRTYDQNPDPAPIIPPDLSGNIRRVPRWAKQRNFYGGQR